MKGQTWLRLAGLVVAVTAAALVIWQKHLLAHPAFWPGLMLVLAAALPFLVDARFPRLLRAPWPGAVANAGRAGLRRGATGVPADGRRRGRCATRPRPSCTRSTPASSPPAAED